MNITVAQTPEAFVSEAASRIVNAISVKPQSVIGLSTGRTTGNIHRAVCAMHAACNFDVSQVTFFGLDEVTGVDREYSGACYKMLKTEIIESLGIPDNRFLMLPTQSADFAEDCREFKNEIKKRGGIDLLILGLGENGHLGFNQPGTPLGSVASTASMDERLEARIRRETNSAPDAELGGVTLGIADIMHARRIVLVANGENKREIVKRMFFDPISPEVPATVLRLHPTCEFLLDGAAAADLDLESLRSEF